MGRIVVHIGTHKTGTTSIQKSLAKNRAALLARNILYPDYGIIGLGDHYAHLGMANALAGQHPKYSVSDAENFFLRVRRLSEERDSTIISAEPLYRQILGNRLPQSINSRKKYWQARHRFISKFRDLIGPAEIAIVIRRQDDFAESMYQEQIKVTKYDKDFKSFIDDFWFHFDYHAQISAWKMHFDTVRIIPFNSLKGEGIAERFLKHIEIEGIGISDEPMQNIAMPHDGVILKRLVNSWAIQKDEFRRITQLLQSDEFRKSLAGEIRSFFPNIGSKEAFLGQHWNGNMKLAHMSQHSFQDLFGGQYKDNVQYADYLSEENLEKIMRIFKKNSISLDWDLIKRKITQPQRSGYNCTFICGKDISGVNDFVIGLDSCRLDYSRGGSTLIVSFDNAGSPHRGAVDRKPWGHKFFSEEGHSILGVIAGSSDWYRGKDLHETLSALRDAGFFSNFKKVVFTGSSMGGYGASAFASLVPGCHVIAFNPQSTLRADLTPWDTQHPNGLRQDWTGAFSDGAHECKLSKMVYIFYDPFHELDQKHALRYDSDNACLLKAPFLGHGLPDAYRDIGVLKEIMRRAIDGTLTKDWYYSSIRGRSKLPRYYKNISKSLAESGRNRIGRSLMSRASKEFEDPYFYSREAVFMAAEGDVVSAINFLEMSDKMSRAIRRRKNKKEK